MAFLCSHRGQKYGILPLLKVKSEEIRNTCAGRFQSSVNFLTYENFQMQGQVTEGYLEFIKAFILCSECPNHNISRTLSKG